jgi:hypothetical protein
MTDPIEVPLSAEPPADTEDEDLIPGAEGLPVDVRDDDFEVDEFTAADLGVDPDAQLPEDAVDGEGDDEEDAQDEVDEAALHGQP